MQIAGKYLYRSVLVCKGEVIQLTPGSEVVAWMKDEIQIKKMYAKMMGIEGETWSQSHGALFRCQRGA